MDESEIQRFWDTHPCGESSVSGLDGDFEQFFSRFDDFRYAKESHLPRCLDEIEFRGKAVLEIGLGQGADSEQMVKRGGIWSGIDLTEEAVNRVRRRFELRDLPYQSIQHGSVLDLPYADQSFDIVFSHGVLHHVPDVGRAQKEIARVLKPRGSLIMMVYARYSLNYLVSIAIVRRLGLTALYFLPLRLGGVYDVHIAQAREVGLVEYLKMSNFIHRNTDGPLNPFSRVYSLMEVRRDFSLFRVIKHHREFMHAPPLPVSRLPGVRWLGWHLWVHMIGREQVSNNDGLQ
ncbi:MAG: class I SAM-dependent methyltransferase [Gemmatimonadetes bacterium]|nr:class I SAM-dependent methyltransferase [Gemmatimonadota bacterium]